MKSESRKLQAPRWFSRTAFVLLLFFCLQKITLPLNFVWHSPFCLYFWIFQPDNSRPEYFRNVFFAMQRCSSRICVQGKHFQQRKHKWDRTKFAHTHTKMVKKKRNEFNPGKNTSAKKPAESSWVLFRSQFGLTNLLPHETRLPSSVEPKQQLNWKVTWANPGLVSSGHIKRVGEKTKPCIHQQMKHL